MFLVASASASDNLIPFISNDRHVTSSHSLYHANYITRLLSHHFRSLSFFSSIWSDFCFTDSFYWQLRRDNRQLYPSYWKSLFRAHRSLILLHPVRALFTVFFAVLFACTIRKLWAADSSGWNVLVHCSSLDSRSPISCSPCSALEIEAVYSVWEKRKWNGLPGA